MFKQPLFPLLQTYHSLCLHCPSIERNNVLNWLISQGTESLFRWNLALDQVQCLSQPEEELPLTLSSNLTPLMALKEVLFAWQKTNLSGILIVENGLELIPQNHLNILLIEVVSNLKDTDKSLIFLEMGTQALKGDLASFMPTMILPIPTVQDLEELSNKLGLETPELMPGLGLSREEICQGVKLAQATQTPIPQALLEYKVERFLALGLALNPTPTSIDVGGMDLLK